jgi:hypothetical protein
VEAWRVRRAVNWANLSTPLGLTVGRLGRARVVRAPRGVLVAGEFGPPLLGSRAMTIGSVVITRRPAEWVLTRPRLLAHEERHAWQYAACLGLPMLPLYVVSAALSWLWCRNPGTRNPFEMLAGLADGGYPLTPAEARDRHASRRTRRDTMHLGVCAHLGV